MSRVSKASGGSQFQELDSQDPTAIVEFVFLSTSLHDREGFHLVWKIGFVEVVRCPPSNYFPVLSLSRFLYLQDTGDT